MNKPRIIFQILAITALTVAFASTAQAQASRTWVSGVGDDANPCSRTAPCKTFAGAISKTAAGGEIDVLDPGGFGAVTITKAITIDGGEGQIAGVLVSGTNGIVIQAGLTDQVTLRNLDINGLGTGLNGVEVLQAQWVTIDHCQIYGFNTNGVLDNRTATQNPAAQLFVNDSFIRANSQGVAVIGASGNGTRAFIDHCRIEENNGFGVSVSNSNLVHVLNSTVGGNRGTAVNADTGAAANVVGCFLNGNNSGAVGNGSMFMLANTSVMNNGVGVSGTVTSFGNNFVSNNGSGNTIGTHLAQQ